MGQKVNPHGLRVGVIKDWDSRWYAREDKVGELVVEDYNIRKYLKTNLYSAGIAKIEIERNNAKVKINIHCSRPGVIIGKGGTEIEKLRLTIDGTAEDKCGTIYRIQFRIPKADFSGNFDLALGGDQTVHAFEAESLAGSCGGSGALWDYTVFASDAADAA